MERPSSKRPQLPRARTPPSTRPSALVEQRTRAVWWQESTMERPSSKRPQLPRARTPPSTRPSARKPRVASRPLSWAETPTLFLDQRLTPVAASMRQVTPSARTHPLPLGPPRALWELESMETSSTSMTMATLVVETAIPMALPTPSPLETPLARPTQETIPSILSSRLVQLASRLASPPLWASVSTVQKQPLVPPLATPWPSLMWRLRRSMTELVVLSTLTQRPLTLPRALESTEATSFP